MTERLANFGKEQSTLARLDAIGLNPVELAQARAQVLRAEAIAEILHGAWLFTSGIAQRAAASIARKSIDLANAYAESAIRAGARKRDEYLARATDTADLERRLRMLQAPARMPLLFTRS